MAYISFQPSDYFNTLTYSGTGGNGTTTSQAVTGAGFQPDWVWLKQRTSTQRHQICDVIRGANNIIGTDRNGGNVADSHIINSFDSDGFTAGYQDQANDTGHTYVSWLWRAANSQGSANTTGSINTTYTSANTTSGFSIIQYNGDGNNGATIGHGLGVAPRCVIIKRTDTTSNWIFGTGGLGFNKFLYLNDSASVTTNSGTFNSTAPSNSVITLGTWNDVNNSSGTYICYAFAEIKGYSKFNTYVGNGNANGTFVYCGFKPAMVLFKQSSASGEKWYIYDNKRNTHNVTNSVLFPNASDAESPTTTGAPIDILSNGFKLRGTDAAGNGDGSTYVFMAFAEHPIVSSNGVPVTAK